MNVISAIYLVWLSSLGFHTISFGIGGIELFSAAELEKSQVGYSHGPNGENYAGEERGAWKKQWIAIGYETAMGDPIILDTGSNPVRILSAAHGEGEWNPDQIADSLEGFEVALKAIRAVSSSREGPLLLEKNPLSEQERKATLAAIAKANPKSDITYWMLLLEAP